MISPSPTPIHSTALKKFSKVCPACEILWRSVREQEGGTSLILWLRLCIPSAGGLSSITSQGARSHVLQLKRSWHNQIGGGGGEGARRKPLTWIPRDFTDLTVACQISWNLLWLPPSVWYFCDCGHQEKNRCVPSTKQDPRETLI